MFLICTPRGWPKKNEPKTCDGKAYGYVRVSTDEQAEEGLSLRVQRSRIRAYAKAKNLRLIDIFADEGISGRSLDREGIQSLLDKIGSQECETVVVYKLSRLSRSTRDILFLIEELFVKGKTHLISISESIDTSTPMGRFFLTIMGALAQMERELIAERTKAALDFKKERGERLGSAPYGYKISKKGRKHKLVQDKKEMKVVRRIFKMHKQGLSLRAIAKILNKEKIKTKRGGKWYASTVRAVLTHPIHKKLRK